MKTKFYYNTFLSFLVLKLLLLFPEFALAKGGGGGRSGGKGGGSKGGSRSGGGLGTSGGGNRGGGGHTFVGGSNGGSEPFFRYTNGRRVCTTTCMVTFTLSSIIVVGILICCFCIFRSRYKTKTSKHHRNTTDFGESGISNNINANGNHNDSLPPSYESTNPAPDPPHEFGGKHEATKLSLCDAREFSKQHPPNESLPTLEEIENIIIQDNHKAWKFIAEDIIRKAQRAFISDDERIIELHKKKKGFKYDDIMIQTNYPFFIPDIHAVNSKEIELEIMHYFEITLLSKISNNTTVAIGIATKPYPYFRLPGWNQNSVGYHSDDGRKFWNDEFGGRNYGPNWGELGDVIGCGYKPKTGEIFFTKNGKFLGMAFAGLRHVWYPSIGSDGDVKIKVNFGDEEFIYKDAQGYGIGAPRKRIINANKFTVDTNV